MTHVRLNRRLFLTADKTKLVGEGDPEAAFFYGGPGHLKPKNELDSLGAEGAYGEEVSGDELKDVVHVEVETPNPLPGSPRVEGSGKATIPVTQADRAAAAGGVTARAAVSGVDRRHTEGEAFLEGELKPLPGQSQVGPGTGRTKQMAQKEPAHYAEGEEGKVKTEEEKQDQPAEEKRQPAAGNKQAKQAPNK